MLVYKPDFESNIMRRNFMNCKRVFGTPEPLILAVYIPA